MDQPQANETQQPRREHRVAALIACAALLAFYTAVAWAAVLGKSATFDEPHHSTAAWVQLWRHDFRIDPQNGALWHDWIALATGPNALQADFNADDFRLIPEDHGRQWTWITETLYQHPGNDAQAFLTRQRAMSLVLAVALGALIAAWSWRLAGPLAAVVATALFALDPNFLAHGPLVKNDVPFSLVWLALFMIVAAAGRRLTWLRIVAIGVVAAAIVTVKASGVIAGPLVLVLFVIRAMMPWPWQAFGREWAGRGQRLLIAGGATVAVALMAYVGVWAVYGFRFSPTAQPGVQLDLNEIILMATRAETVLRTHGSTPDLRDVAATPPGMTSRAVRWAQDHRLLPQAWLNGFLYQYQASLLRNAFLLDRISPVGWWYYFPLAILFKTPLATLAALAIAAFVGLLMMRRSWAAGEWWTLLCVLVPPILYLALAMSSHVNAGVRHVLPVYAFAYIGVGCVAAFAARRWQRRRLLAAVGAMLALGLAVETVSAYPDFIPFFNTAAGGARGGLSLLGDSNLDWGQDLPVLADWQSKHPDVPLYLSYFGFAEPASYGIHYIALPRGYGQGPRPQWPSAPGVVAISATNLQGIWLQPELYKMFYAQFRRSEPTAVLGGSIYLYDLTPRAR